MYHATAETFNNFENPSEINRVLNSPNGEDVHDIDGHIYIADFKSSIFIKLTTLCS